MLFHGDFFYLADQSRDYMLVKDMVQNHKLTLIGTHSGIGGFFHGPIWLYYLVPFYLFGSGNPFTFTFAYPLLVILTILSGFFFAKKLYDTPTGLVFAFFFAASPSIWSYMIIPISANALPLVFVFLFYFLIKYIRGDTKSYIFAIFFAGLSLHFETALALALIPIVIISFFLNKKALRQYKVIVLSIVAFFISIGTFILFDLRHQFLMVHSFVGVFTNKTHENGYLPFSERIISHLISLRFVYESLLVQKNLILEINIAIIFVAFLFYLYKKKIELGKIKKEFWYLLLFPVFLFIIYLDYGYTVFQEYLLALIVPVGFAGSIIVTKIWKLTIGKIFVTIFVLLSLYYGLGIIFHQYQQDITAGSYLNQECVAQWILQDSKGKQFGYFVYTPDTYTDGMDYLLWWESKKSGKPQPISQKLPITYLILYPKPVGDDGAYTFWEKTKIKTAAPVIETKVFQGGITVEKLAIKFGEPAVDPTYYQNLIFR